jgi:hypothetical protein
MSTKLVAQVVQAAVVVVTVVLVVLLVVRLVLVLPDKETTAAMAGNKIQTLALVAVVVELVVLVATHQLAQAVTAV